MKRVLVPVLLACLILSMAVRVSAAEAEEYIFEPMPSTYADIEFPGNGSTAMIYEGYFPEGAYSVYVLLGTQEFFVAEYCEFTYLYYPTEECYIAGANATFSGEIGTSDLSLFVCDTFLAQGCTILYVFSGVELANMSTSYSVKFVPVESSSLVELESRPFLTTSFEDYSIIEGFLLLIFVVLLISFFLNLFRR